MKFTIPASVIPQPLNALRKAGYAPFTDPNTGQESYTLRTSPDFYPRFHLYVSHQGDQVTFDLHLDQKQPSYGVGTHKHAGEYEGKVVEDELKRVYGWIVAAQENLR